MIKAIIFDMDGVIFDTERLALEGWLNSSKAIGYEISQDIILRTRGLNAEKTKEFLQGFFRTEEDYNNCRTNKQEYIMNYISKNGIPKKEGLIELLNFLQIENYKIAIATSTGRDITLYYLRCAGLLEYFDQIICGDEVFKGKPEPEIYIKAANKLGISPENCMVLEDSQYGITSAYRAHMKPVMIPDLGVITDCKTKALLYAEVNSLADVIDMLETKERF